MGCKRESLRAVGILLLAWAFIEILVGTLVLGVYGRLTELMQPTKAIIMPVLLIGLGFLSFTAGLRACVGNLTKNKCALAMFLVFFMVAYAVSLTCLLISKPSNEQLHLKITHQLDGMVDSCTNFSQNSIEDNKQQTICAELDYLQSNMKCCGHDTYEDWFNNSTGLFTIPQSCCVEEGCFVPPHHSNSFSIELIHNEGCADKVEKMIQMYSLWIFRINWVSTISQTLCLIVLLVVLRPNWLTSSNESLMVSMDTGNRLVDVELTQFL